MYNQIGFTLCLLLLNGITYAQDTALPLPAKYLYTVEKKVAALTQNLDKKTARYLQNFQKREQKLYRKLERKDSTKAAELLTASQAKYLELEQALRGKKSLEEYIPALDTLTTSLKFLSQHKEVLANTKEARSVREMASG